MSAKILIVEPDVEIYQSLKLIFDQASYRLQWVNTGQKAFEILEDVQFDLVITELCLPDISGYAFVRQVAKITNVVIYCAGNEVKMLRGFEEGTDDFVVKSVISEQELLLRVRAILRRTTHQFIQVKNIRLDVKSSIIWLNDRQLKPPKQCFLFLLELAYYPNQVRTRDQLLAAICDEDHNHNYHILYTIAHKLRNCLEISPRNPQYIHSIHGVGYILKV